MPSEDQLDQLEQLDALGPLDHLDQLHQLPAQFWNTGLVKVINTSLKPTMSTKGKAELVFLNIFINSFNHYLFFKWAFPSLFFFIFIFSG